VTYIVQCLLSMHVTYVIARACLQIRRYNCMQAIAGAASWH
jgi:hypothetical protein